MRSSRAAVALLLPLQKLEKDAFTLLRGEICKCRAFALQEGRELRAGHLRLCHVLHPEAPQHLLRDAPARPAGNRCRKVYVAPRGMTRGRTKLVPLGEESFGELFDAAVAIAPFRPTVNREHRGNAT